MNVNDVPLSKLCNTFSGSPEVMSVDDFNQLGDWYERQVRCGKRRECFTFHNASSYFMRSSGLDTNRHDLMHYANAQFFCKRAPNGVRKYKDGVEIDKGETCYEKRTSMIEPIEPCRLWPQQETSPMDSGNWYLASVAGTRGAAYHVNCYDKTKVYQAFLESVYDGIWSEKNIKTAADQFRQSCIIDKGSDGYMLIVGPLVALMGGILTTMTMFKAFAAPPYPDLGTNMLVISIILLFIGFWNISLSTTEEVITKYTYCGDNFAPLVWKGRWYDTTPCLDRTTDDQSEWHPFVAMILFFDSVYVAGGVLSFLATLIYLGLSSGFTETMMNDRMGKYLVTLQDIPMKVRIPNPPPQAQAQAGAQESMQRV
jgi:hypothetical protein